MNCMHMNHYVLICTKHLYCVMWGQKYKGSHLLSKNSWCGEENKDMWYKGSKKKSLNLEEKRGGRIWSRLTGKAAWRRCHLN